VKSVFAIGLTVDTRYRLTYIDRCVWIGYVIEVLTAWQAEFRRFVSNIGQAVRMVCDERSVCVGVEEWQLCVSLELGK
jgi:hypothetical protein